MTGHDVMRWHNNPDPDLRLSGDTVSRHQTAVEMICLQMCARIGHPLHNSQLLEAAQKHDEPEKVMGDWPAPLIKAYPWMRPIKAFLDWRIRRDMGLNWTLTAKEKRILHLADKAECWDWARRHGKANMPEWQEARGELFRLAQKLGPDAVAWVQDFTETTCTPRLAV